MIDEKELNSVIDQIMSGWDVPGLAAGIVKDGSIIYAKGFGVQSLATRKPVSLDSVFCVQSVSKCLVATALMRLVELGGLVLDTPLVDYLPHFRMDDERCQQITLRQALSHTSGMPDLEEIEYVELVNHPETDIGAPERFVRGLATRRLIANPGERFSYSNIAYNVLGHLIASVTQQTFESYMRENILLPCGMPDSTFTPAEVPPDRLAWPHLRAPEMKPNPSYPYHRADAPASFLHTTVIDLCHWAITSLKRGETNGGRILSSPGYDLMWTPVAERGSQRPAIYEDMGLGWTLGHIQELKTVSHGGAGFGGTAFLLLLPEVNYGVVVLCNEESSAHQQVVRAVSDTLLGRQPKAGRVSWMVPISRALAQGGLATAYDCYTQIKDRQEEFHFGEYDLIDLSLQLWMAQNEDLAIEVLNLNLQVFPGFVESLLQQARYYLQKRRFDQARASLSKALEIEPGNPAIFGLLESFL
jgi:CubicO group peptidase (beta-lactamase class C family)